MRETFRAFGGSVCELRPVAHGDASTILEAWGRHAENFSYLTARVFADVTDAERYIAKLFPTPESKAFHIVAPSSSVIGMVKATITEHRAQIGYVVHKPFWGHGVATSAVRELVRIVETMPAISRVWATCALENPASARVLEKCGFEQEAILKNWVIYPAQHNRPFDNYSYVKIPERAG